MVPLFWGWEMNMKQEDAVAADMFRMIAGVGVMTRREFKDWFKMVEIVGVGVMVPPPIWEMDDLPLGSVGELSPEADQAGMECVAEALFKMLRSSGKFRRLEAKTEEMASLVKATRELLRSEICGEQISDGCQN
jgi:hypothetical protein